MTTALHDLWQHLQRQLFPLWLEEVGDLGAKDRQFVPVVALLPLGPLLPRYDWKGVGCPPHARVGMIHACIAKEVYQFPTREARVESLRSRPTLRRLCGWESVAAIPSLSTFSRACAQFAAEELPQQIHAALVGTHCGPQLVGHVSRDATAISVPERPAPAPAAPTGGCGGGSAPGPRRRAGPKGIARGPAVKKSSASPPAPPLPSTHSGVLPSPLLVQILQSHLLPARFLVVVFSDELIGQGVELRVLGTG